ncbi:stromal interaction molecule homolog isoform X4 [Sitodiplosis mosellana]|uniref:stromal interaction molecule homolog isoform X4 n=1 Tax=Sitodiplosis mosellana TaxID=263140 RepID=UPI002444340A|nr:stromal interaction molecule homolog isoform X4 [Sitodiplosis mosellana]XP_055297504.1 stromal interaction molecule homolog isoform X4 [Sitodiplosis mosellana]
MYLPVILQTRCLAIVFCSLITISQANVNAPSAPQQQQQQQQFHHHNNPQYSQYKPPSASQPSGASLRVPTPQQQQQQQHLHHGGSGISGSADGACPADDIECAEHDRLGMEAIRSLHQQLDDDDNGNIDLSESDDFLREELKYDSGYEKRHKTFHYNDDTQISVKELWEAWLRSEVHNWTVEQTTDWLAESVQLPQYVEIFQKHKVNGQTLPRLAVHNMHYVSNVLGIRDPIHKQKIALKAMDVVLFGPPRETGTRWKDYILVTLLLSAIIGCWYAYQQNKSAKRHLRRMAKDMEGLQKAENALADMQKELEQARLEQENVATEKLDLERRLKEAPSLSSSSSDLEVQQLKAEIEMLRSELSRAEVELVDHCWTPPPALQSWLQLTYELESKHTLKKRIMAEKQLQAARDACEKLKRKRSSLVGAFVSTHGKSIDDVDRSIVEARNALSEVTNELQERLHRWKQIELLLGFGIVNNNGIAYLESVLYNRNGSGKSLRSRISGSQDELDDESVQASSSTIFSGLKAQTWSPWSPHHQSLINRTKSTTTINNKGLSNLSSSNSNNSNNNNWTTTQPIRRASMTSSRSADENCASRLERKPFKRTNTFDTGLLSSAIKIETPKKSSTNDNSCDADSRSSSSSSSLSFVEKAGSLENVSTRSNPF